jgi:hypothetical protein
MGSEIKKALALLDQSPTATILYIPFCPKIEYLEDKINYINLYIYQYKNKSTIVQNGNNQNFCDK